MKKLLLIGIFALILGGFATVAKADNATSTNSTPLFITIGHQCKTASYTPWGPCVSGFNVQLRTLIADGSGCDFTTSQQVEQIKFCNRDEFFGYSIK